MPWIPTRSTVVAAAVAVLLLGLSGAQAQAQGPEGDLFGAREPVRLLGELTVPDTTVKKFGVVGNDPTKKRVDVTLTPSFIAASGVNQYGASLAVAAAVPSTSLPFQLRYAHRVLDYADVQRNRAQADARLTLTRPDAKLRAVAGAQYIAVSDVNSRQDVSLGLEAPLRGGCARNCLSVAATGAAVRLKPRGGAWTNGGTVAAGLILRPTQENEISADYRFKSGVLGAEDFSLSFRQRLATLDGQPTLVVTGARQRVLSLGVVFRF